MVVFQVVGLWKIFLFILITVYIVFIFFNLQF